MDYKKSDKKFIKTSNKDTAKKLQELGFTELPQTEANLFCFLNDGRKLTFDVEKFNGVYTNIICF